MKVLTVAGHGVELPFVFHTASLGGLNYTASELVLTDSMVKYWTTFAHTGNPNPSTGGSELPDWPQYRVDSNTGTKTSNCLKFRAPNSEVSSYRDVQDR